MPTGSHKRGADLHLLWKAKVLGSFSSVSLLQVAFNLFLFQR